jgi:membrane-associated phospholipid phosphatase
MPPPPPSDAAVAKELKELHRLAARRDSDLGERIAYWSEVGPAYRWNAIAAEQILDHGVRIPLAGRHIALVNVAVHDSILAAWYSKYVFQRPRPSTLDPTLPTACTVPSSPAYPSAHAAAASAAAVVLAYLFPERARIFLDLANEAAATRLAAGVSYPSDIEAGTAIGREVGARAVAWAKSDRSVERFSGEPPTGPDVWIGTDPLYPMAGKWKTWVLVSGRDVLPPPPPEPGSPQKLVELAELKSIERTPVRTSDALFWEWGAGGFRIWYFWNQQTSRKILEHGFAANPPRAARALTLQSIAFHDAAVACWQAKYAYWAIRPSQLDAGVKPLFPPPNHPSYPSGHSCMSSASAGILRRLFPDGRQALDDLARQAGEARLWAGIHYRSDVEAGQAIGEAVAARAFDLVSRGNQD